MATATTTNQAAIVQAALQQTAATAGTNPSDDVSSNTSTSTSAVTVTTQEQKNINNPTGVINQPAAVVIGGPSYSGAGGGMNAQQAEELNKKNQNVITKVGGNQEKTFKESPNPLDAFSSYTYGLTLHVLTREDYNTMVGNPGNFKPTKTLISSAGRYQQTRDPAFKDDFYFDNLKFETVIGLSANSRSTNVITLDFTIIEPYGMTLLDRIMDVNNTGLNGKNYLDMPYLLEINFFGADDSGKLQKIVDHTKWIPIKLTGMKIKASVKGAEYAISAVPFNHAANMETVQSIKTRIHVTASTVGDYFSMYSDTSTGNSINDAIDEETKRKPKPVVKQDNTNQGDTSGGSDVVNVAEGNAGITQTVRTPANATTTSANTAPITVNAKSFVAAYNGWFGAEYRKGNLGQPDVIEIRFNESNAKEISGSAIVDAKKNSARRVGETDAKTTAKSTNGNDAAMTDFNSIVHDLEPGTSVNEVINTVLSQSEYFLKQAIDTSSTTKDAKSKNVDNATTQQQAQPVKMWKIIPTIQLLKFDSERNQWAKRITFWINTFMAYQNRDDRLPKSPPPTAVKKYDYFYTGHNSSVIDFSIDFNALYYTAINVDRGATTTGAGASQKPEDTDNSDKPESKTDNHQVAQEVNHPVSGNQADAAGGGGQRSETQNARSALQSLYTSAGGDMINLKMQIIGDPEFIKQDDLYINPGNSSGVGQPSDPSSPYVPGTKSLDMDSGEIYCYVTFRTPKDFNDSTGMYDLNSSNAYSVSEFSGFYRILTVTSEFRGGKFTQTLDMVRQPKQDAINKSKNSNTDVKTVGDNERQVATVESQQAGNPAVSANNVNPSVNADTPTQPNQTRIATTGADGDAAVPSRIPTNRLSSPVIASLPASSAALGSIAKGQIEYDVSNLSNGVRVEGQFNIPNNT